MKHYIVKEEVEEFKPRTEQEWLEFLYHGLPEIAENQLKEKKNE